MPLLFCPGRETTIIQHPPENGLQGPSRRNKVFSYAATALADVPAGAVVLISGFAGIGWPEALLTALHSGGADRLTLVCQGVWPDHGGQRQGYSGVERLVTDSGALGYRAVEPPQGPSSSPAELVDSNGRRVVFAPGGVALSLVDVAAMIRTGYVGTAVLQPARVGPSGDFTHWTTAYTPGVFSPASAIDWASGSGRVIAMMPHTSPEGLPNIVGETRLPLDGVGCVDTIITDVAVFSATANGLTLLELAPGWSVDEVSAITGASLNASPDVKEMTFDLPHLEFPGKVYNSGLEALQDLPNDAVVNIDGFAGPGGMAHYLLTALRDHGAKDLTLISNTAGIARVVDFGTPPGRHAIDHSILVDRNQVAKAIASYPVSPSASRPSSFELAYQRGEVDLEVVPQSTLAEEWEEDIDLINASGQFLQPVPGMSFSSSSDTFAMIRGGHVDVTVLGSHQPSAKGDVANWMLPQRGVGNVGGAMDLAVGANSVIIAMEHTDRRNQPKIVEECTSPITAKGCVSLIVTDLAVIQPTEDGLVLKEFAPGWTPEEVQELTAAKLIMAPDLKEYQL